MRSGSRYKPTSGLWSTCPLCLQYPAIAMSGNPCGFPVPCCVQRPFALPFLRNPSRWKYSYITIIAIRSNSISEERLPAQGVCSVGVGNFGMDHSHMSKLDGGTKGGGIGVSMLGVRRSPIDPMSWQKSYLSGQLFGGAVKGHTVTACNPTDRSGGKSEFANSHDRSDEERKKSRVCLRR